MSFIKCRKAGTGPEAAIQGHPLAPDSNGQPLDSDPLNEIPTNNQDDRWQ